MTLSEEAQPYIKNMNINRLNGRVLRLPTSNKKYKRSILLIYGSHATIERNFGIAEELSKYGSVTVPDLPGLGGMDSFYKIGLNPTIDNYADYLATFIKLEYKNKRFSIAGFSLGFLIVTRMLDKYPELAKKIDLVFSIAGFSNRNEFIFTPFKHKFYIFMTRLISRKVPSAIYRYTALNGRWLKMNYHRASLAKSKFEGLSKSKRNELLDMEVHLWHANDVRTWAYTTRQMLTADQSDCKIEKDLYHIDFNGDQYFDGEIVLENMQKIYKKVIVCKVNLGNHSPTVIASAAEAAGMIPTKMRTVLKKSR